MKDILQDDLEEKNQYLKEFSQKYCENLKNDLKLLQKHFDLDCRPLYNDFVKKAYENNLFNTRLKIHRKTKRILLVNYKDDNMEIIVNVFNGSIKYEKR